MSIKADKIVGTYDIYSKQYVSTFTEKPALINVTDCAFELSVEATFECSYTGLSIADGTTGDTVSATLTKGTVDSISPTTYQSGSNTYTVGILAPDGYLNAGSIIDCTTTATGINPPPPPTPPPPTPPAPTPPTPTPVGSYDCNSVTWAIASFDCGTGAISVTANYGSTTIHSYSPTSATPDSGVVTITYTFSDADPAWDNTGTQITCTNLSVDTTCAAPTPPPTPPTPPPTPPTPPPTPPTPPPTPPTPPPTPPAVNCYIYDIAADGGETVTFTWTTCNGGSGSATVPNGDSAQTTCAQEGTVSMSPNSGTITLGSSC